MAFTIEPSASTLAYYSDCKKFVTLELPELLEMSKEYEFTVPDNLSTSTTLGDYRDENTLWFKCSYSLFKRAEQAVEQTGGEVTNLAAIRWLAQNEDVVWKLHGKCVHAKMI